VRQEIDQKFVGLFVAGGECDACGGGSRFEKGFDGFGGAAVLPVGIGGGEDGSLQGSVSVAVECVDGGAGFDEGADGVVLGSPGGYVESGAVGGDLEVAVSVIEGGGADAEFDETAEAFGVVVASELREESSALCEEFGGELRLGCGEGLNCGFVVLCAGGDELVEWWECCGDAALIEEV